MTIFDALYSGAAILIGIGLYYAFIAPYTIQLRAWWKGWSPWALRVQVERIRMDYDQAQLTIQRWKDSSDYWHNSWTGLRECIDIQHSEIAALQKELYTRKLQKDRRTRKPKTTKKPQPQAHLRRTRAATPYKKDKGVQ